MLGIRNRHAFSLLSLTNSFFSQKSYSQRNRNVNIPDNFMLGKIVLIGKIVRFHSIVKMAVVYGIFHSLFINTIFLTFLY